MAHVEVIYYVDVLSSWCWVAERAVERIEQRCGGAVRLEWRIAQLFDFGPLPFTQPELEWYYSRTEKISGVRMDASWRDSADATTKFANQAAEACRNLGVRGSDVRRGLARAALVEGKPLGRREVALAEAARLSGLPPEQISAKMDAQDVQQRIAQTTQEFKDLALPQLPSFVLRNTSGDLAVFSGLYTFESLDAVIAEMLHASRITEEAGSPLSR